jgi:hypothetical protein
MGKVQRWVQLYDTLGNIVVSEVVEEVAVGEVRNTHRN